MSNVSLRPTHSFSHSSLLISNVFRAAGENVKEFFFRVASLAFETNVLAELEKSGSRQIGDVISEYLSGMMENITFVTQFNTQLIICFRNQQQFHQSVHFTEEETAKLLPVRMEGAVLSQRYRRKMSNFLGGKRLWLLFCGKNWRRDPGVLIPDMSEFSFSWTRKEFSQVHQFFWCCSV